MENLHAQLLKFLGVGLPIIIGSLGMQTSAQQDFSSRRADMVRVQLKGRDIVDKNTLSAMGEVPRQAFVPKEIHHLAYADRALPIGNEQTISQPYIVAYMTQALKLNPGDKVLEVGTGSGYQAAILAAMGAEVYTIEIVKQLAEEAKERLTDIGYSQIKVRAGDGYNGWPSEAPFDAIIVTAGAEALPRPLIDQLKDGGRMIIPVGPHQGVRQLQLLIKSGSSYSTQNLMAVRFVPFTREN